MREGLAPLLKLDRNTEIKFATGKDLELLASTRDEAIFHVSGSRGIPRCPPGNLKGGLTSLKQYERFPEFPVATPEEANSSS